jgi:hypothetical protein
MIHIVVFCVFAVLWAGGFITFLYLLDKYKDPLVYLLLGVMSVLALANLLYIWLLVGTDYLGTGLGIAYSVLFGGIVCVGAALLFVHREMLPISQEMAKPGASNQIDQGGSDRRKGAAEIRPKGG